MKYYLDLIPDSGEVLEFSIEKKGTCRDIQRTCRQIVCRTNKLYFYKVILDKDGYKENQECCWKQTHTEIQQKDIVNTNLYEIKPNTNDSIRFNLNMTKKELEYIPIDSNLKSCRIVMLIMNMTCKSTTVTWPIGYSFKLNYKIYLIIYNIHTVDYVQNILSKVFNYAYEVTQWY